jgi:hypothetical protein
MIGASSNRHRCQGIHMIKVPPSGPMRRILGDIANYTDLQPVMQMSEVVVERG